MPTLRELLEAPDLARSLQPGAMAEVLGELVLLLARFLAQASATPGTTQATNPEDPDRLLTVRETAALLSVRPPHVYELVRRHTLPAVRVGRFVRLRARDLHAWTEGQREKVVDTKFEPSLSSPPPMTRASTKAGSKSR
jgi:excisionase family DNA binding protein